MRDPAPATKRIAAGSLDLARRPSLCLRSAPMPGAADIEYAMGYLFLALALTLNAVANILLKVGAGRLGDLSEPGAVARLLTNYHLLAGLALFALNVAFYAAALTRLNLSVAYPVMTAGGIVIVVSVSILVLREAVTAPQVAGLALLVVGIVLVTHRSFT